VDDATTAVSAQGYDLVFAADVLPYLEDPSPLLVGPRVAFSTELAAEGTVRRPSGRYAHSEARICELLAPDLEIIASKPVTLRTEGGKPVHGLIVLACNDLGRGPTP
jgi:predicted TPR repeat methyltransferase